MKRFIIFSAGSGMVRGWMKPKNRWTDSLTWTTFASPSLKNSSSTTSWPFTRTMVSRSLVPSSTRATSSSRNCWPSIEPMMAPRMASRFSNSLSVRTRYSARPSFSRPPERLTFCRCSARTIASGPMPSDLMRSESRRIWISSSRPPLTRTCAMPSCSSRSLLRKRSAASRISVRSARACASRSSRLGRLDTSRPRSATRSTGSSVGS